MVWYDHIVLVCLCIGLIYKDFDDMEDMNHIKFEDKIFVQDSSYMQWKALMQSSKGLTLQTGLQSSTTSLQSSRQIYLHSFERINSSQWITGNWKFTPKRRFTLTFSLMQKTVNT